MQQRQWSPAEAAEFTAARLAHVLRMLADDPKARLGMHRAVGIARRQGYGEVAVMGLNQVLGGELLTALALLQMARWTRSGAPRCREKCARGRRGPRKRSP